MLHDDRNVGGDHRAVLGGAGDRLGIGQFVEAEMTRATRRHRQPVGTGRLAVMKIDRNLDRRVARSGIQDARGLVAAEFRCHAVACGGDVALGDRPATLSDSLAHLACSLRSISARPEIGSLRRRRWAGVSVITTSSVGRTCASMRWPPSAAPSARPRTICAWITVSPGFSPLVTSPTSETTSTCSATGLRRYCLLCQSKKPSTASLKAPMPV